MGWDQFPDLEYPAMQRPTLVSRRVHHLLCKNALRNGRCVCFVAAREVKIQYRETVLGNVVLHCEHLIRNSYFQYCQFSWYHGMMYRYSNTQDGMQNHLQIGGASMVSLCLSNGSESLLISSGGLVPHPFDFFVRSGLDDWIWQLNLDWTDL